MRFFPKPVEVNRWGHTAVWNLVEAAQILAHVEPDAGNLFGDPEVEKILDQLARAASLGFPKPFKGPGEFPLFLPIEVVTWFEKTGQGVDSDLKAAVIESTKAFVEHRRRIRGDTTASAPQQQRSPATQKALERFGTPKISAAKHPEPAIKSNPRTPLMEALDKLSLLLVQKRYEALASGPAVAKSLTNTSGHDGVRTRPIDSVSAPAIEPLHQANSAQFPATPPPLILPQLKQPLQEQALIEALNSIGLDPLRLPKVKNGKPGSKSLAWDRLKANKKLFGSRGTFDKAWERLRGAGQIKDE